MQPSVPSLFAYDSRVRPVWFVVTTSILSFGAYAVVWFGLTWSDLQLFDRNKDLHPALHAFGVAIPGYGAFRTYDHFARIRRAAGSNGRPSDDPVFLGIIAALSSGLAVLAITADGAQRMIAWATAVLLVTLIISSAQSTMNACWYRAIGRYAEDRVTGIEWAVLIIGLLLLPLIIWGALLQG